LKKKAKLTRQSAWNSPERARPTRQGVCKASEVREQQNGKKGNSPERVTTRQSEQELARAHEGGLKVHL
jgi:hypothetical protein